MTVGEALRLLRTQKGMTLARAANNALSTAFLSKVERDQNEITFEKLLAILANSMLTSMNLCMFSTIMNRMSSLISFSVIPTHSRLRIAF